MKALLLLAAACLVLTLVPASNADPLPCYRQPCVAHGESVTLRDGANVYACEYHQATMGTCVAIHAGRDRVVVGYGSGITSCAYGVDLTHGRPIAGCVV